MGQKFTHPPMSAADEFELLLTVLNGLPEPEIIYFDGIAYVKKSDYGILAARYDLLDIYAVRMFKELEGLEQPKP